MKTILILSIFCLFFMESCDYGTGMTGKVFDKETGQPISNATVNLLDSKDIKKTNNEGFFAVYRQMGAFKVDPVIEITKKGYKPFQMQISSKNDKTSYFVKSETKWVDFNEPLTNDSKAKTSDLTGTWIEKWSQNFTAGDTLLIYLTKDDEKAEIEKIETELKIKKW